MASQSKSMQVAQVDEQRLNRVRSLENELGTCVVAYEPGPRPAQLSQEQLRRLQAVEKELGIVLVAYACD